MIQEEMGILLGQDHLLTACYESLDFYFKSNANCLESFKWERNDHDSFKIVSSDVQNGLQKEDQSESCSSNWVVAGRQGVTHKHSLEYIFPHNT